MFTKQTQILMPNAIKKNINKSKLNRIISPDRDIKTLKSEDIKTMSKLPKFSVSDYLPDAKLDFEEISDLNDSLDHVIRDSIYAKFGVVDYQKIDDELISSGVQLYLSPQQR